MKYIGLKLNDNWGNKSYSTRGNNPIEVEFKEGQELNVQWPDDSLTIEKIRMSNYSEHINDMGHEYTVNGQIPAIKIKVRGLEIVVDNISKLKFRKDQLTFKETK